MTRPLFIAFSGRKQSGKDSCATFLTEALTELHPSLRVAKTHFAEPLKRICNIVFGIPLDLMYGSDQDKETLTDVMWDGFSDRVREMYHNLTIAAAPVPRSGPMTIREVLQIMGTDIFREQVADDVWAKAPFRRKWDADVVLIPDCRFMNEVLNTVANNGMVLRVERNTELIDLHQSETSLDDFQFRHTVQNNGTLNQLRALMQNYAQIIVRKISE